MEKSPFSTYQKDLPPLSFAPLNEAGHHYDALILGGGLTGVSAALEQQKQGQMRG